MLCLFPVAVLLGGEKWLPRVCVCVFFLVLCTICSSWTNKHESWKLVCGGVCVCGRGGGEEAEAACLMEPGSTWLVGGTAGVLVYTSGSSAKKASPRREERQGL